MREQEHNYELYELKNGFKIVPREENRPSVYAIVNKYGFWSVSCKGRKNHYRSIPLYNYYSISDKAVELLYETWTSPRGDSYRSEGHKQFIHNWAMKTTSKTLSKKMRDIWKRVCLSFDPRIEELHRKLYSVSNGTGYWGRIEYIIKNRVRFRYLIDDLLKYHAARVALLHGNNMSNMRLRYEDINWDFSSDWKRIYLYNEYDDYTSLNKTLMNMPYGITFHRLFNLKNGKLPEPATSRMKLWAYCTLYEHPHRNMADFEKVILRSTDEDIREAIRYMWHYFPIGRETFRSTNGIHYALQLIFDYPLTIGKWDMLGLSKRSEQYHHDEELRNRMEAQMWQERREQNIKEWEEKRKKLEVSKTALPPISLPNDERIKFLDSFISVINEGKLMQHCIAQYAEYAVEGNCYLFHVDYEGEMASVEVAPNGYVNQSYGPRDTINKASEYGRKTLNKWAKDFNNRPPHLRKDEKVEENEFQFQYRIGANYATLPVTMDIPF